VAADPPFGFVQLEFGFRVGPRDGHFILREHEKASPRRVLVLGTLGAPERRRLKGRKGRTVTEADAEPVPTTRATVVLPEPFATREAAAAWLAGLRSGGEAADAEVQAAVAVLNEAVHAHRVAAADAHARDVSPRQALVTRIGFGSGSHVAEGRYEEAWELPRRAGRTRRSLESPDERFAALLGGRDSAGASEELVLRARMDVDAGRRREAALQARVALEALLADASDQPAGARGELESDRYSVGDAANAALRGPLDDELWKALTEAVVHMEAALRRRRLPG
jgi:hypothetical protein